MKIAVIADIHGNYYALEAVLEQLHIDTIICAGDMINPLIPVGSVGLPMSGKKEAKYLITDIPQYNFSIIFIFKISPK